MADNIQRIRDHVKKNEGYEKNPYPDTKGNVTVGIGFMVPDADSFAKMPSKPAPAPKKNTKETFRLDAGLFSCNVLVIEQDESVSPKLLKASLNLTIFSREGCGCVFEQSPGLCSRFL